MTPKRGVERRAGVVFFFAGQTHVMTWLVTATFYLFLSQVFTFEGDVGCDNICAVGSGAGDRVWGCAGDES